MGAILICRPPAAPTSPAGPGPRGRAGGAGGAAGRCPGAAARVRATAVIDTILFICRMQKRAGGGARLADDLDVGDVGDSLPAARSIVFFISSAAAAEVIL